MPRPSCASNRFFRNPRDRRALEIEGARFRGADAFLVIPDPFFNNPANRIPDIMARLFVPALYGQRQAAEAGGLMSYGSDLSAIARRHAHFVDRVLRALARQSSRSSR